MKLSLAILFLAVTFAACGGAGGSSRVVVCETKDDGKTICTDGDGNVVRDDSDDDNSQQNGNTTNGS